MTTTGVGRRAPGTVTVLRFNWPKFVAVGVLVAGAVAAVRAGMPGWASVPVAVAAACGVVWSVTSVAATWWSYDHRRAYDAVAADLGDIGDWVAVHAGFDDATAPVVAVAGAPMADPIALVVAVRPSLRRARRSVAAASPGARPAQLPLPSAAVDTVLITFAVHEVRDPDGQRDLFAELHRVLRPGGRLVVTEHHRDLRNAAVYGPAAWHFQPRSTWIGLAVAAGFGEVDEAALSPFVHRLVWVRPGAADGRTLGAAA